MALRYTVTSMRISDGTSISVPANSVLAFVGPNNAGKTVALKEIAGHLRSPVPNARVVTEVRAEGAGTPQELDDWLKENAHLRDLPIGPYYSRGGIELPHSNIHVHWREAGPLQDATPMFVFSAGAEGRLGLINPTGPFDMLNGVPSHPLHVLQGDSALEEALSTTSEEAFGLPVTLGRVLGSNLELRVGQPGEPPTTPPTAEYIAELKRLPALHEQGDGMRSFLGVMLSLVAGRFPVVLVDEPEAFLHPPQARLLGRKLAAETPAGTQVFLATHSSDVLQGLLDEPAAQVTVVRLVREGDVNKATVLESQPIRKLWEDPLLRYSNVLDGLFHHGVVVCEGDADCRFYSAVLDAENTRLSLPAHDLLFTQTGGKDRMHVVVRALKALEVPVRVIADLDVLHEGSKFRNLITAMGGTWDELESDWRFVSDHLGSLRGGPATDGVRQDISDILDEAGPILTPEVAKKIRDVAKVDSGWEQAKISGVAAVRSGQPRERCDRLLGRLRTIGLFVVPVGVLERWVPQVGGKSSAWVAEVLRQGLHSDPSLAGAGLMRAVADSFNRTTPPMS